MPIEKHAVPPELSAPLGDAERAEIERFIRVLDYEKHSGAEHRAVGYLRRLYGRLVTLEAAQSADAVGQR
jgi:hypothetical protein